MIPCSEESFVGGVERGAVSLVETASSEGVFDIDFIGFCLFAWVVFVVDGGVVLRGAS